MSSIITTLKDAVLTVPPDLSDEDAKSRLEEKLWTMKVEDYVMQKAQVDENKTILYTIIWEQCTTSLRIKLKGTDGYEDAKGNNDCVWLLISIRGICLNYEGSRPKILSLDGALEQLCHIPSRFQVERRLF